MAKGLTEQYINVIVLAKDESRRLGHRFVCTEQILIGIISEETNIAARLLKSMGVTLEQAKIEVEKIIGRGSVSAIDDLNPFSPEATSASDLAKAAKLFESMGITLEQARIEVEKIIGRDSGSSLNDMNPFSPKIARVIDIAEEESQLLGNDDTFTGAEHLLLGIIRIEDGVALQVLANLGVDSTKIRDQVVQMLQKNTEK
jgi:ATP-dependent Clp protease ATP-binding subunit ClpC